MSAVRKWTLFLRAVFVAIGILALGVGAFRAGVIENERVALWPTFELLHLETLESHPPPLSLALIAAVQITTWTILVYFVFVGLDSIRHSGSRRS